MHVIIITDSALKWSDEDEDIGSEDYLGLKADKLVYGEVSESIYHGCLIGAIQFFYRKPIYP